MASVYNDPRIPLSEQDWQAKQSAAKRSHQRLTLWVRILTCLLIPLVFLALHELTLHRPDRLTLLVAAAALISFAGVLICHLFKDQLPCPIERHDGLLLQIALFTLSLGLALPVGHPLAWLIVSSVTAAIATLSFSAFYLQLKTARLQTIAGLEIAPTELSDRVLAASQEHAHISDRLNQLHHLNRPLLTLEAVLLLDQMVVQQSP